MKNSPLTKPLLLSAAAAAVSMLAVPASAMDILARVISSTPVVQQVAVPRQVCNNEAMVVQAPKSGAGALLGAVAGGAAGNAIGSGGGRAAATFLGLVGGAMLGDSIEGSNSQIQNVQQCATQTFYENRTSHYNVVYQYADNQYSAQMVNDPGPYVRLQVTPVGAMTSAPQPYQTSQSVQGAIQPAPVYVQPVAVAPVAYPVYYGPSYYAPYYPPLGISLNFGYSRGFGHHGHGHGHGHWR